MNRECREDARSADGEFVADSGGQKNATYLLLYIAQ